MASADNASESALRNDLDAIRQDMAALKDDLRVLASDAASAGSHTARAAKNRISEMAGMVSEKGHQAYDAAKAKAQQAGEAAGQQISDHPFASVAVAFGVGVLLGAIVSRR